MNYSCREWHLRGSSLFVRWLRRCLLECRSRCLLACRTLALALIEDHVLGAEHAVVERLPRLLGGTQLHLCLDHGLDAAIGLRDADRHADVGLDDIAVDLAEVRTAIEVNDRAIFGADDARAAALRLRLRLRPWTGLRHVSSPRLVGKSARKKTRARAGHIAVVASVGVKVLRGCDLVALVGAEAAGRWPAADCQTSSRRAPSAWDRDRREREA